MVTPPHVMTARYAVTAALRGEARGGAGPDIPTPDPDIPHTGHSCQ
ncbi:hypothetical protein [Streptomyces sp. CT34]|nr:hypothetical protein [Streptomyces sp. CT34]